MRAASFANILLVVLIAVLGAVVVQGQKVHFDPREKSEILERLSDVPETDQERAARIKAGFTAAGCGAHLREQAVNGESGANIVCELPGEGSETIVIGAHYDHASTDRPIDNWNAAWLLPAIYHSLHGRKRRHNFIFVAFADHGNDPLGASAFISSLSASQLGQVEAMVNLDVLGLSPTKVWSSHSNKELVHDLVTMVYALKLPASQIDMEKPGYSDAKPFVQQQIPSITIHSLTQGNLADGTPTPFRPDSYYDSYRLICGYLAYLDLVLKARPHSE